MDFRPLWMPNAREDSGNREYFNFLDRINRDDQTVTDDILEASFKEGKIRTQQQLNDLKSALIKRMTLISGHLADVGIELSKEVEKLGIDTVTGLGKREKLEAALISKIKQLNMPSNERRRGTPLKSIVVFALDLDNLKEWNEKGHSYGDQALRIVADALKANIHDTDSVFRLGDKSDEMIAILGLNNDISEERIQEINNAVNKGFIEIGGIKYPVTASIEYITLHPGEKRSVEDILKAVDERQIEDKVNQKAVRIAEAQARLD